MAQCLVEISDFHLQEFTSCDLLEYLPISEFTESKVSSKFVQILVVGYS